MTVINTWIWLGFSLFIASALLIDTFLLSKQHARMHSSVRVVLFWVGVWVSLAFVFNGLLWLYLNHTVGLAIANQKALEFFTGYLIEESLSVDNLFVFYMIFQQFHIPIVYQHRVLSYGIWGAIIMRLLFILLGTWLVRQFHWILCVMGVFLLMTGVKILFFKDQQRDITENLIIRGLKKIFRITHELHDNHFFIHKNGLLYATPLFIALVLVEFSDVVFALDSIPAIFAVTTDPFIVWSSNIFAILGLRTLYFLLANAADRFALLKYGIALILIFVGTKMLIEPWFKLPVSISLAVVLAILSSFIMISLLQRFRIRND